MKKLRFALFGTGFWARFQLSGWRELEGVECVALYNRTRSKAEAFGRDFGIDRVFDDPEELLRAVEVDFVDIVTHVGTHADLTLLAARHGRDVICQKPLAVTLVDAEKMLHECNRRGVKFLVHENWRWQSTARALREELDRGTIGEVFRASIEFATGYDVFANQPSLAEVEQLILSDIGSHMFDVARFFFGEARDITCWTGRVHPRIRGEDCATAVLRMGPRDIPVMIRMAYAGNPVERECFPETLYYVEGSKGTIEVSPDCVIRVTTAGGTHSRKVAPPHYPWGDSRYALAHSSIVPCNTNLLGALRGESSAETSGEDNLRTVRLVHAAYDSALERRTISFA